MQHPVFRYRSHAFTQVEALAATALFILIAALAFPFFSTRPRCCVGSSPMKHSSLMRGIHQSMVIFAQDNNTRLPGLDANGNLLPANAPEFAAISNNSLTGASMSARYYILLNRQYVAGDLLIGLHDEMKPWTNPSALPTSDQFSFAALRIGTGAKSTEIGPQSTRAGEWRDSANSQAIMLLDRNTGPSTKDLRSVWSGHYGPKDDWSGTVLWGDNHAEFIKPVHGRLGPQSLGAYALSTKYGSTINSNDFLFSSDALPGKSSTASAMFGYTSQNF